MSLQSDDLGRARAGAASYDASIRMGIEGNGGAGDEGLRKKSGKNPEGMQRLNREGKALGFKVFEPTSRSMRFVYPTLHPRKIGQVLITMP
jgi:hypothetical protein